MEVGRPRSVGRDRFVVFSLGWLCLACSRSVCFVVFVDSGLIDRSSR